MILSAGPHDLLWVASIGESPNPEEDKWDVATDGAAVTEE